MPPQIKYIVGNEAAERFSFYGMRAILTAFMVSVIYKSLGPDKAKAVAESNYHYFVMAVYFLPLLGGYLSDRFFGKYRTIMALSLVYCAGHAVLALTEGSEAGLLAGLGLIALGGGGIKPCVSAHVGDQFSKKNRHLVNRVFDIFYWSINFGSFFSTLLIPLTYKHYGPTLAFGVPGLLMFVATFVFWLGRKQYVHVPPTGKNPDGFLAVSFDRMRGQAARHPAAAIEGHSAVLRVLMVFAPIIMFWALFDQSGSSWVVQGMHLQPFTILGLDIDANQMQALNPLLVMAMIPLFSALIYPGIEKLGIKMTPLRRMGAGMFMAAASFAAVALVEYRINGAQHFPVLDPKTGKPTGEFITHLSMAWQILPYVLITAAEIMVSITGLEFAYTQAPRAMKSTIMSFWLLTVSFGNLLAAQVFSHEFFSGVKLFLFFAGLTAAVAVLFSFLATLYKVVEFIEPDREAADGPAGKIPVVEASDAGTEAAAALPLVVPPKTKPAPAPEDLT